MKQHTTVFDQLTSLVPKKLFDSLANSYHVDKHTSVMRGRSHLAILIFAQIAGLNSLRDLVHALSSLFSWQKRSGLVSAKRSTLADANKRIDYRFYRDLFYGLLEQYRDVFDGHRFPLPGKLFTLDSTTIKVCLSRFPWAVFRRNVGAIKLHTLMDNDGNIPSDIVMTNGKVHDIRPARKMNILSGATYLLDRGYIDYKWLYTIAKNNAFFVTRWKINVGFRWSKAWENGAKTGVVGQWIGWLDGASREKYPDQLRVVKYIDPETKKEYWFLTNLLEIDAQAVADLYKQRWQIELFFKWIKQNLKIKAFLGTSENAVLSQIWVAMIVYLLLKVKKQQIKNGITAHQLLVFICTHALLRIQIGQVGQGFQGIKTRKKKKHLTKARSSTQITGH